VNDSAELGKLTRIAEAEGGARMLRAHLE